MLACFLLKNRNLSRKELPKAQDLVWWCPDYNKQACYLSFFFEFMLAYYEDAAVEEFLEYSFPDWFFEQTKQMVPFWVLLDRFHFQRDFAFLH